MEDGEDDDGEGDLQDGCKYIFGNDGRTDGGGTWGLLASTGKGS